MSENVEASRTFSLRSGISKEFKKSFVLDEDTLRRVHGVLSRWAEIQASGLITKFHVEREDDRFYESLVIDDVLADPNIPGKRIRYIAVTVSRGDSVLDPFLLSNAPEDSVSLLADVSVSFRNNKLFSDWPREDEVHIRLTHSDRSAALLLADEIEPQVLRVFKAKSIGYGWLLALLFPLGYLGYEALLVLLPLPTGVMSDNVIIGIVSSLFVCLFFVIHIIFDNKLRWRHQLFGPESGFTWGEEGQLYRDRDRRRENLFWAVVIGFVVSVIAGLVVA